MVWVGADHGACHKRSACHVSTATARTAYGLPKPKAEALPPCDPATTRAAVTLPPARFGHPVTPHRVQCACRPGHVGAAVRPHILPTAGGQGVAAAGQAAAGGGSSGGGGKGREQQRRQWQGPGAGEAPAGVGSSGVAAGSSGTRMLVPWACEQEEHTALGRRPCRSRGAPTFTAPHHLTHRSPLHSCFHARPFLPPQPGPRNPLLGPLFWILIWLYLD